jgi:hypothetical protein
MLQCKAKRGVKAGLKGSARQALMMAKVAREGGASSPADEGIKSSSMSGFQASTAANRRLRTPNFGSTEEVTIGNDGIYRI